MQLKKCADRSGANFAKMAILARLPFAYSLRYINILYIKSTHFWCRFQIQKKKLWFKVKNVNPIGAGLWNDVVDWGGGTFCPDSVFRRVPPLNIFGNALKKKFGGTFLGRV